MTKTDTQKQQVINRQIKWIDTSTARKYRLVHNNNRIKSENIITNTNKTNSHKA